MLEALPRLTVLYLIGNPLVSVMSSYRMRVIARLPRLAYLDDAPIFGDERPRAESWFKAFAAAMAVTGCTDGAEERATAAANAAVAAVAVVQSVAAAAIEQTECSAFAATQANYQASARAS